ncbi:MAG: 16S rRNA (uracil(1498)-N(3))-methyltransferase [Calditrichaceae bacterium]
MEIFFANPGDIKDTHITLDDFEKKHILQSLKKNSGDTILITDGKGSLYQTVIESKKPDLVLKIEKCEYHTPPEQQIGLGIGFIRPSRLEFALEKGTELGISKFYIFRSQFSNYYSDNTDRYEKILRQAMKQSLQYYLPELIVYHSLDEFIQATYEYNHKIAAVSSEFPALLQFLNRHQCNEQNRSILISIGPEGGFSDREIQLLTETSFLPISLGKNRLRAETAAITAISAIQLYIQQQKEVNIGI